MTEDRDAKKIVERLALAKQEWAAVKAARANGSATPPTPNLDEIRKEHDLMATQGATRRAATAPKRPATLVTYTVEGKEKRLLNRTYTLGYLAAEVIGGKGATAELRKQLAALGVTDPEGTTWEVQLPNGKRVGAVGGKDVRPAPAVPAKPKPPAKASKKSAATQVTPIPKKKAATARKPASGRKAVA